MTYVDYYDKTLKLTFKYCNKYVIYDVKSGELLYINFLHEFMSTLGLYPEGISPEIFFFQWPGNTRIHCIYQRVLKEGNCDNKYLRFLDLQYNNFEVL